MLYRPECVSLTQSLPNFRVTSQLRGKLARLLLLICNPLGLGIKRFKQGVGSGYAGRNSRFGRGCHQRHTACLSHGFLGLSVGHTHLKRQTPLRHDLVQKQADTVTQRQPTLRQNVGRAVLKCGLHARANVG